MFIAELFSAFVSEALLIISGFFCCCLGPVAFGDRRGRRRKVCHLCMIVGQFFPLFPWHVLMKINAAISV